MPHTDPAERRAYYRQWKQGAKKRLTDKFYDAASGANRRAARYGIPGRITTADARAVLVGARCAYCGTAGHLVGPTDSDTLGLDHRVPLALGGPNELANLVAACHACNASKHRSDRPRRWAWKHEACVECDRTAYKHIARGLCSSCYWRDYEAKHPNRRPHR